MKYNKKHFQKAHEIRIFKDKIYNKLRDNTIRERIIKGQLKREECDNKEVFKFLKLLKLPRELYNLRNNSFTPITVVDWINEVTRVKKCSASSIFSQYTYIVYKCALESNRMMNILVKFHNMILRERYNLKR